MPHIVLEKAKNVKDCYDVIEPVMHQIEKGILKTADKYINKNENTALIESITVEAGKSQSFFIQLSSKGDAVTIRLLPKTDPEKTKGVKTLMALIAKTIKDSNSDISYGKTNLQDFLIH